MTCYNDIYNLCASCDNPFEYSALFAGSGILVREKINGIIYNFDAIMNNTIRECDGGNEYIAVNHSMCYALYLAYCPSGNTFDPTKLSQLNNTISTLNDAFNNIANDNIQTTNANNTQIPISSSTEDLVHMGNIATLASLLYEKNQTGEMPVFIDASGIARKVDYNTFYNIFLQYVSNTTNNYYLQQNIQKILQQPNLDSVKNYGSPCKQVIPESFVSATNVVDNFIVSPLLPTDPNSSSSSSILGQYSPFSMNFNNTISGFDTNSDYYDSMKYDGINNTDMHRYSGMLSSKSGIDSNSYGIYLQPVHPDVFQIGKKDFTIECMFSIKKAYNEYDASNVILLEFSAGGTGLTEGKSQIIVYNTGINGSIEYVREGAVYNEGTRYRANNLTILPDKQYHVAMGRGHKTVDIDEWSYYFDGDRIGYEEVNTLTIDGTAQNINNMAFYDEPVSLPSGTTVSGSFTSLTIGNTSKNNNTFFGTVDNLRFCVGVNLFANQIKISPYISDKPNEYYV